MITCQDAAALNGRAAPVIEQRSKVAPTAHIPTKVHPGVCCQSGHYMGPAGVVVRRPFKLLAIVAIPPPRDEVIASSQSLHIGALSLYFSVTMGRQHVRPRRQPQRANGANDSTGTPVLLLVRVVYSRGSTMAGIADEPFAWRRARIHDPPYRLRRSMRRISLLSPCGGLKAVSNGR